MIPPGVRACAGCSSETYTGDGPVSYWNRYVAVTQMHGQGNFTDPRLGIDVVQSPDLVDVEARRAARRISSAWRRRAPPAGSFDAAAAARGRDVFRGAGSARRATAGRPSPTSTPASCTQPAETGMDPRYAARSATEGCTGRRRSAALWQHAPYFHDGSAATLADVVEHYDGVLQPGPDARQQKRTWWST